MPICKNYKFFIVFLIAFSLAFLQAQNADESVINDEFAYANKLLRDNYPELAIVQFQLFVNKYPGEARIPEALRRIAESQQQLHDYPAARATYERLNIKYPYSPFARDVYYQIARCHAAEKNDAGAAEFFELYARFSSDAENASSAMLQAGKLYLQLGENERGRKVLFETIDLYPEKLDDTAAAQLALLEDFTKSGETGRAFRMADEFLQEFPEAMAGSTVWLIKARLHKSLGQLKKALSVYDNVLSSYKNTDEALQAGLESGEILFLIGDRKTAFTRLSTVISGKNDSLSAVAQIKKAEFLLQDGQNQAALETLKAPLRFDKIGYRRFVALGNVYFKLEEFAQAFAAFTKALETDAALADSIVAKIRLRSAQSAYHQGNAENALEAIRLAGEKTRDEHLLADLLQLEGDVYLDLRADAPFAIRIFSRYITIWPHQPQIDDVQARLARSYEKKQNWLMAADEWRRLLQLYPASYYAATARDHVELIEKYMQPDLSSILATALDENFENEHPGISKVKRLMLLHSWDKAIVRLRGLQGAGENDRVRTQIALLMGQCYFAKASRERLLDRGNEFALYDSAKTALEMPNLEWKYEEDIEGRDLILGTILLQNILDDLPAPLDKISRDHQSDKNFADINEAVLQRKLKNLNVNDETALAELRERLDNFQNSGAEDLAAALYFNAQLALALKDTAATLVILQKLDESMNSISAARAMLMQAQLLQATKDDAKAKRLLLVIQERFFYHEIAQTATYLLAKLDYENNDFEGVRRWLQQTKERSSGSTLFPGSQLDADVSFLNAQTLLASGNTLEASNALLQFVNLHQQDARAPKALFELAEITAQQKIVHLAREYYLNFLDRYKGNSLAPQVRLALTKLELEEHRYVRARELALQCLTETGGSALEAEAMYDAILAQLRQDKIKDVSEDMKSFRKKFPQDVNFYGSLQYELGEAWIRAKNFGKAEDTFKDLRKDLKNTNFAIRGELGLARTYLLRNKTDDGLEILKKLPQEYAGHLFLRNVYIELGDFYQTEKMWQPAISSYNQVLSDTLIDDRYKEVLVKLIDLYANIGLSDAAISYTRHYIKTYPNDDKEFAYRLKIATLYRDKRDFEQAIAVYRELLPLAHGEDKAEILFFLGDSYYNLQRYEQAAAEFMKMKYFAPKTKQNWRTTALFKAGDCYLQLENLPKARDLFDLVLRLEGEASVFGRSAKQRIQEIDAALQKKQSTGFFQLADAFDFIA